MERGEEMRFEWGWLISCLLAPALPAFAGAPPAELADHVQQLRVADTVSGNEARCLAHPDLPGNAWSKDAAKWRCALLRAPAWTLDEIDALLAGDDGVAELDRRFSRLLEQHYRDQNQREQIFRALSAFDDSERAGAIAARWVSLAPGSGFAHAALASHHAERGWKARGSAFVQKTAQARLNQMSEAFNSAVPLFAKALELEPNLSPACIGMASIGRQMSDALQAAAMSACARIDSDSYYFAYELVFGAQPRWGGSEEQLRNAVAYAAARVDRNPILGALLAEHVGDAPSLADDPVEVADELLAAARMAPSGTLIAAAAGALQAKQEHWEAVIHFSQALRFWPEDDDYRADRARSLIAVGELEWALRDVEAAARLNPQEPWHTYQVGWITHRLYGAAASRPYFKQAMSHPKTRARAIDRYCHTLISDRLDEEAERCTADFVTEFPKSGEAWRQRTHVLARLGRRQEALAALTNFEKYASADNQMHQRALLEVPKFRLKLESESTPTRPDNVESASGSD